MITQNGGRPSLPGCHPPKRQTSGTYHSLSHLPKKKKKRRRLSFKFWYLRHHTWSWTWFYIIILSIANDFTDLKKKTGYHEYESDFTKRHNLNNKFTFLFYKGTSFPVNMLRTNLHHNIMASACTYTVSSALSMSSSNRQHELNIELRYNIEPAHNSVSTGCPQSYSLGVLYTKIIKLFTLMANTTTSKIASHVKARRVCHSWQGVRHILIVEFGPAETITDKHWSTEWHARTSVC